MGAEITESTIPAELGDWLVQGSVSFTKGCFTGQELVARIDSRGGNVPRHLRVFTSTDLPPAPGSEIVVDTKTVGAVTSSAIGAWGDVVGLAFVHRSMTPPFDATAGEHATHSPIARPEPVTPRSRRNSAHGGVRYCVEIAGRRTTIRVPRPSGEIGDSTSTVPPIATTSSRTMARPRPDPDSLRAGR